MGFNKSEKENRTDFLFYLIFSVPCPDKQISTALTACTCDTQYQFNAASLTQRLGVFVFLWFTELHYEMFTAFKRGIKEKDISLTR